MNADNFPICAGPVFFVFLELLPHRGAQARRLRAYSTVEIPRNRNHRDISFHADHQLFSSIETLTGIVDLSTYLSSNLHRTITRSAFSRPQYYFLSLAFLAESPSFDTSYATLHSTAEKWRIYPVPFFVEGLSKTLRVIQVHAGAC